MTTGKLNLIRVHDHSGSHLAWRTDREQRQARRQHISQWCSDTSLAAVAAVAMVWKRMRRPSAKHLSQLTATPERGHVSPHARMRIDTHV